MKTAHFYVLIFACLLASCSNNANALPELRTPSIKYLVLHDNHSKVVGEIIGSDTTLSLLDIPAEFTHSGNLYNSQSVLVYQRAGVLGLIASGLESSSNMSLVAYYGLDIVDVSQNLVYATSCDDKHTCQGVQCSSCKLAIVDCTGSCDCDISAPGSGTGSSYCEHSVTSGGGGLLDNNSVFEVIANASTHWDNK